MTMKSSIFLYICASIFICFHISLATDKDCLNNGGFLCPSGRCISPNWLCDGEQDCEDNADEQNCSDRTCRKGEFKCANSNKCIPQSWVCDSSIDCTDRSDEDPAICTKHDCPSDHFRCHLDGKCIPLTWVCDSHPDCVDGSDELSNMCVKHPCNETEFSCKNERCIPKEWECDRDDDCGDNSDEHDKCSYHCDPKSFQCVESGKCIPYDYVCDGQMDCSDRSDEMNCKQHMTKLLSEQHGCRAHEFQCHDGACISERFVCDGDVDCPDMSDEMNCLNNCSALHFRCASGKECIPSVYRCNGRADCADGSDEKNCASESVGQVKHCSAKQFDCGNGFCIDWDVVCDGKQDCPGYKVVDEEPFLNCSLKGTDFCKEKPCEQLCTNTPIGPQCSCRPGYTVSLTNPKQCNDINECNTAGKCSQICINTIGSYVCKCHGDYVLLNNKRSCRANGPQAKLLLTNRLSIRQFGLISLTPEMLVNNLNSVVAIDYSYKKRLLFWSDISKEQIFSCQFGNDFHAVNASDCERPIISNNVSSPDGLAVDWIHDLIYWTDTGLDTISVATLDGKLRHTLIHDGLDEPRAIAVDPSCGMMFWTDWGVSPKIESAAMDGTNRFAIDRDVIWPNGLTLDMLEHRLYWVDAKLKQICSSNYFGQDKKVILNSRNRIYHPFSVSVFEETLYWTDWNSEGVHMANKFTGENNRPLLKGMFGLMTVKIFHPLAQPNWENKCENSECAHLCVPSMKIAAGQTVPAKMITNIKPYVCLCSDGYSLQANARDCVAKGATTTGDDNGKKANSYADASTTVIATTAGDGDDGQGKAFAKQEEQSTPVKTSSSKAGMVLALLFTLSAIVGAVSWFVWKQRPLNVHFGQFFCLSYPFCRRGQDHYDHLRLTLDNEEYQSGTLISGTGSGIYQPTVKSNIGDVEDGGTALAESPMTTTIQRGIPLA
ncbi:Very low-density lipoprotein receptor [Trichinella patagoniensis]|uniref:Very low-density lipoprotein receptor n=2 Tax=Trichinella patagoniensis TaxID=990121 RepID=A0A0V0ZX55_9BILA|nr:Very low-density lipoprotein receptor [Trichinella patagoniensis]